MPDTWQITYPNGHDVLIYGPGNLEILLRQFDLSLVVHHNNAMPEIFSNFSQRHWTYPLWLDVKLRLVSTTSSTPRGRPDLHSLSLGCPWVKWTLSDRDAEAFHRLMTVGDLVPPPPGAAGHPRRRSRS
jgi:hypothetical protein